MPDVTLTTLQSLKLKGEKITMLTCYDATFAHASCQAGVEVLLVGDSLGMVLQGNDSTLPVTTDELAYHTASVKRGNRKKYCEKCAGIAYKRQQAEYARKKRTESKNRG